MLRRTDVGPRERESRRRPRRVGLANALRRSMGPELHEHAAGVPYVFPTRQIEGYLTPGSPSREPHGRAKSPANPALIISREPARVYRTPGMNACVWETVSGDVARKNGCGHTKGPR